MDPLVNGFSRDYTEYVAEDSFTEYGYKFLNEEDPNGANEPEGNGEADEENAAGEDGEDAEGNDAGEEDEERSPFDIPRSEANYTDSHNVTHPLWAKPFFT